MPARFDSARAPAESSSLVCDRRENRFRAFVRYAARISVPVQIIDTPATRGAAAAQQPPLPLSTPAGVAIPASGFLLRASWSSCDSIERSASVKTRAYQLL